jgi:hypothetical protein
MAGSNMSPRKKMTSKASGAEASGSTQQVEGELEIIGATYDDTTGILEKDRETLKWGEIYHMFKKSNFSVETEDPDELQAFKNIRKSWIFRVATHPTIFPCTDAISWILKNTDISNRYICNMRKEPIASFRPDSLAKCYHIEEGSKRLDGELLNEFEYTPKDLFPKWYKEDKQFKYRPKSGYPTSALRRPYQYLVAMLCRLYGNLMQHNSPYPTCL